MILILLCKAASIRRLAKSKTIQVMKLTAVLLLVGCLHVVAAGNAQKVSIDRENAPLRTLFADIKKQTGYVFFFNARLLENAWPVSISVKKTDMRQVLEEIFKDQPLIYRIVNKTIVISPKPPQALPPMQADTTPAAIFKVTGKIIDDSTGQPIEGASIIIKGSKLGTASNARGEFSIEVKRGVTLVISFVGYEPKSYYIKVPATFSVRLKAGAASDPLTNVVVTGYQVLNKESFTGNAVVVSGEELRKVNPVNVLSAIQAFDPSFRIAENNIAGSDPNKLPYINMRGSTALPTNSDEVVTRASLQGDANTPLFILDGYEVSLQKVVDLDNSRILSLTLLKDAAATAVYGSRAANGVVVITTKTPKAGKLQVYYNADFTVSGPDLSGYKVLNAAEKLEYERLAGVYNSVGSLSTDDQELIYYGKKQNVVSGVNTYWLSQPLRTALGQKHSLYLEGGTKEIRYGIDLRYQTQPGVMKGSTRDRYSLGADLSYNPTNKFQFRNSLTVTQVNATESPYGVFSDYVTMNPYYPKTDSLGNIAQEVDSWLIDTHQSGADQYNTTTVLNPLYNATLHSFNKNNYLELIDAFSAEWTIINGLRLRGVLSATKRKYTTDKFSSPYSNEFYFYSTEDLNKRGSYTYEGQEEMIVDGNMTLAFNKQIEDHFFNATAGANIQTQSNTLASFTAIGFSNDRFTSVGFAQGYAEGASPYSYAYKQRLMGLFLSSNYAWKNKYLLDVSLRVDGSSKFGSENKIAPFWSMGIGWNVHKEDNFNLDFVSMLKLRASTGMVGSVNFDPYMANTSYNYSSDWYSTGVGATVAAYGNESLKWQRTRTYDAGIDLGLFKDRIFISPRYYYKLTNGLLADINVAPSTGFTSYKENLGDMKNEGFELSMKANVVKTRNWYVALNLNMTRNTNTIVKISNALKAYNDKADELQQTDDYMAEPLVRYQEGQSLNTIYAVRSLGIDPENGREIFIKKDGTHTYDWSVKDIVAAADNTPTAYGYFGGSVGYKAFLLQIQFYTRFGGKEYNQTLVDRVENADPRYNVDRRVLDQRWKQSGDKALYKNIADLGTSYLSDRFIQSDNILDLSSFYFSYDVSKKLCKKIAVRSLRLSFTMNDAYRWSSMQIERGIDYPYARSFTFSLQSSL